MSAAGQDEQPRSRLGRGLATLIGDAGAPESPVRTRGVRTVPVEFLRPNPANPRKAFPPDELDALAESIRQRGVIQPIIARALPHLPDVYEIIAGERRWRASQRAALSEVPVIIIEADEKKSLEFAIIENVQRSDLNALEEAHGYERLLDQYDYKQQDLAQIVGKSRSHVANTLRLLKLPERVKAHVREGRLSAGHARALLGVRNPEALARRAVEQNLTVRAVERLAQRDMEAGEGGAPERKNASPRKDADTRALEKALSDALGLPVAIDHAARGGTLAIQYTTLEQLEAVCRRLQK